MFSVQNNYKMYYTFSVKDVLQNHGTKIENIQCASPNDPVQKKNSNVQ
jgi:hypothetical protein